MINKCIRGILNTRSLLWLMLFLTWKLLESWRLCKDNILYSLASAWTSGVHQWKKIDCVQWAFDLIILTSFSACLVIVMIWKKKKRKWWISNLMQKFSRQLYFYLPFLVSYFTVICRIQLMSDSGFQWGSTKGYQPCGYHIIWSK